MGFKFGITTIQNYIFNFKLPKNRRNFKDIMMLFNTIRLLVDCSTLLFNIGLCAPGRLSSHKNTFSQPFCRTNNYAVYSFISKTSSLANLSELDFLNIVLILMFHLFCHFLLIIIIIQMYLLLFVLYINLLTYCNYEIIIKVQTQHFKI